MKENINKDNRKLRYGFTTGTCAAAAACGAAQMLLSCGKEVPCQIRIQTPKGIEAAISIEEIRLEGGAAVCAVKKDSGDDPDVTNGVFVYAKVELTEGKKGSVAIDGGVGIGKVTKPGLACQVGQAAINPVPHRMIQEEIQRVAKRFQYEGSLRVEISIPEGVKLAEKTFNPKLGIKGGISILGTSGIVEPMSEQALLDTIKVEINVAWAEGTEYLVLTPGNYGERFLRENGFTQKLAYVKCSNFIGDALDYVGFKGFKGVLLVGHVGKLIKFAAGLMNTHSKYGDRRMETLTEHVRRLGQDGSVLLDCVTTEDAISVIKRQYPQIETRLWKSILDAIQAQMKKKTQGKLLSEALMYSNEYGVLGQTVGTEAFFARARQRGKEV